MENEKNFNLNKLKNMVSPTEFEIWFNDLKFLYCQGDTVYLTTPSGFKKDKIINSYFGILEEVFASQSNTPLKIDLSVDSLPKPPSPKAKPSLKSQIKQENIKSPLRKDNILLTPPAKPSKKVLNDDLMQGYVFDRLVIHKNNKFAVKAAKKVIGKLGSINPLYFYGSVGVGKTHLMQAIGHYFKTQFSFLKVKYINPNDFVSEYTRALLNKSAHEFRIRYRELDVLLFDDIQFLIGKEKSSMEFFDIFNEIFQKEKQMVFASDRPPAELSNLHERLKSRLSSSVIIEIEKPELESRMKIFDFYLKDLNLELSDDVKQYILNNLDSDIRKLIGTIKTLITYRDIYEKPLDIKLCKNLLKTLQVQKQSIKISPETLLLKVAEFSKIDIATLKSKKRTQVVSYFRQLCMYLIRTHTQLSFPEIANIMGGKTPASVHISVTKIEKEIKTNSKIAKDLQGIMDLL